MNTLQRYVPASIEFLLSTTLLYQFPFALFLAAQNIAVHLQLVFVALKMEAVSACQFLPDYKAQIPRRLVSKRLTLLTCVFLVCSTGRSSSAGENDKGAAAGPSSALDSSSESVDGDQKPPSGLDHPTAQTMLAQVCKNK